jgi:hypothetical protein
MPNPEAGGSYTVVKGDELNTIAARAYGDASKWPLIYEANRESIGSDPNLIYPGLTLVIPPLEEKLLQREEEEDNQADAAAAAGKLVTLFIGGNEYRSMRGKFSWAFDTIASSYTAEIVWNPGKDPGFDKLAAPGSFATSRLYLLGKLVCAGRLYVRSNSITADAITKSLTFYSVTKDVVDTYLSPKYTHINNVNVQQLAEEICSVLGFRVKFLDDPGPPFEFVVNPDNETIGKYLQKFAAQRGLFVSCDEHGALVFQKARSEGDPVAHIEYPGRPATSWSHTAGPGQRPGNRRQRQRGRVYRNYPRLRAGFHRP